MSYSHSLSSHHFLSLSPQNPQLILSLLLFPAPFLSLSIPKTHTASLPPTSPQQTSMATIPTPKILILIFYYCYTFAFKVLYFIQIFFFHSFWSFQTRISIQVNIDLFDSVLLSLRMIVSFLVCFGSMIQDSPICFVLLDSI